MQHETTSRNSIFGLFGNVARDAKRLVKQEVQLAKTEISEKASTMGRNAVSVAIGGFVAYAGAIVLLIGLGALIGWAIARSGLGPVVSSVIGIGGMGLVVTVIGVVLLLAAVKRLKQESLTPERTLQTLQELKSTTPQDFSVVQEEKQQKSLSSEEIQAKVEATEVRLSENLGEIGDRLSPQQINAQVRSRIQANPYRAGLIAAVAGFMGGMMLRRKFRQA